MNCRFALFALVVAGCGFALGCQQQPSGSQGNSEKTRQVTVAVDGMTWTVACPKRVREALASLPWVKDVQVNYEKKQATFVAETARYDEGAIIRVLDEEGFEAKVVK